jgi:hypothetical protein
MFSGSKALKRSSNKLSRKRRGHILEPRISLIARISIQNPKSKIQNEVIAKPDTSHRANKTLVVRTAHSCAVLGLAAILLLSLWFKPDPRGLGTHEQLWLRPCSSYALTGLPCPFCGMTTAFAHMARGEIRDAALAQPAGALGFIACVALLPIAIGAAISGKNAIGAATKLPWGKLSWIFGVMMAASWLFKIAVTLSNYT